MQKKYESPEMDVIELEDRDVIVASIVPGPGDTDVDPGGGDGWSVSYTHLRAHET